MKVLYLANPLLGSTGGDRRSFEVLKRVGSLGIEPIIVVDDFVLEKMGADPDFSPKQKIIALRRPSTAYAKRFKSASRPLLDYYSIHNTANKIAQIAKQEQVQLIVSHHEKTDFLCEAYLAAKKCRLPWTCIFQLPLIPPYASTPWRRVGHFRKLYLQTLYAPLYRLIKSAVKSTTPLAVSASIEDEMKSYFPKWKTKMQVLQPGVGVDYQTISQTAPSTETVDALFFSRLAPEKGVYDLPKMAAELAKSQPNFKLVVVGRFDPPAIKDSYEKLVAEYGVGGNLVYKGFVDQATLYAYLRAARVLLYPSRHDAFPLVVLETLAAGTPVVAYDVSPITRNFPADVVKAVPVGDWGAMAQQAQKLMTDKALRDAVSARGSAFAAGFSWDRVAEAERQTYTTLLTQHQ
jgi:glycosyltransferase involved in cell wall biosynthesis